MRTTVIAPAPDGAVSAAIHLNKDERRLIVVSGLVGASVIMTIGATAGGVPLIELLGTDQIDITPQVVQSLTERGSYPYNIWQREQGGGLVLIAAGYLTMGESIAPTGTDYPTTFLSGFGQSGGPSLVVSLTRAAYAALPVKNPDTIYLITG